MSFILDALKKSESDRQRQTGPALFEVKIAPPRSRFPLWAVSIVVLLGVNAAVGGWLLLRHSSSPAPSATALPALAQTPGAPSATPSVAPATAPVATAPIAAATVPPAASAPPVTTTPSGPARTYSAAAGTGVTAAAGAANSPAPIGAGGTGEPTLASNAIAPGAVQRSTQETPLANPDDYAPAAEPSAGQGLASHVKVGTSSGYILYQDAAVIPGANIPQLRLDLHVYAPKPEDRFALVNMHKVREGDSLPEGVRVEAIIPDGVVLSHNGMKFLLPRQ